MKDKITAIYFGKGEEIPKHLSDRGYLVNAVDPTEAVGRITEYTDEIEVGKNAQYPSRDTLEGDARLIMMDIAMLDGVMDFCLLIDDIIEKKMNGEALENIEGDYIQEILYAIKLNENELNKIFNGEKDFSKIKVKKIYLEYVKKIMSSIGYRKILGDKQYEFIAKYVEQMKKSSMERRKDSRYESGDARDLLEGSEQWKPMFILISNQELSERTNSENVRVEYHQLYLMQKLLNDFEIKIDVPAIVNVRSAFDVKFDMELLSNVKNIRDKIEGVIDKKAKGKSIDKSDELEDTISNIIDTLNIELVVNYENIKLVMDKMDILDIVGMEKAVKIISIIEQIEKVSLSNLRENDTPRLLMVDKSEKEEEKNEEEEKLKEALLERCIKELDVSTDRFEVVNGSDQYARGIIDPRKVLTTIDWLNLFANPNNKEKIGIDKVLDKAVSMSDVLDVDGSVMAHALRTSLLMKNFLDYYTKNVDWDGVKEIIPEESVFRYQISDEKADNIAIAAYLHDIGKLLNVNNQEIMNFSATLQTNTGRITSEVADDTRLHHPEIGYKTLEFLEEKFGSKKFLKYAKNMALYHQEYINDNTQFQKGYSVDGKHNDLLIPLEAQMMMIIDVFDAIVSQRNYNPNTTLEGTMSIMAAQGGIRITKGDKSDRTGEYIPVDPNNWCMGPGIKFVFEEGCIGQDTLHFNPVLLKIFFEYIQSDMAKEYSFIKLKDKDVGLESRKVVTAIGTRDFSKYHMHRESGEKEFSIKNIQKDLIIQQVEKFEKIYFKMAGNFEIEVLKQLRKEIENSVKELKDPLFGFQIIVMLNDIQSKNKNRINRNRINRNRMEAIAR